MNEKVGMVCLSLVVMLTMTAISSPSYGASVDVEIKLKNESGSCEIELKDKKEKRFKGVCKSTVDDDKCDGDKLNWEVKDNCTNLGTWKLVITSANDYPLCFPHSNTPYPGTVAEFNKGGTLSKEVAPLAGACTYRPKGVYWPYVITLYDDSGVEKDQLDPGGIIFP